MEQFIGDVYSYGLGLPSRVRSDHSMENFKVAESMLEQRGCDRGSGSIITGSSVHNCRVERSLIRNHDGNGTEQEND